MTVFPKHRSGVLRVFVVVISPPSFSSPAAAMHVSAAFRDILHGSFSPNIGLQVIIQRLC